MWQQFIHWLARADKQLFLLINQQWHVAWLDDLMLLLRHQNTWIPLYLLVLWTVYRKRPAAVWPFVFCSLATFALCDFTSASIIKPMVSRLRPCYDRSLQASMRSLIDCGGRYSFPSTHASNHFGLATIWFHMVMMLWGARWYWVWLWALLVCYAQVYVGKHFPLDIAGGALLGVIVGLAMSKLFQLWQRRSNGHFFQRNHPTTA